MWESQCSSPSYVRPRSHFCSRSWWKPSSHRNPRGKKLRDGTAVKREVGKDLPGRGSGVWVGGKVRGQIMERLE